MTFEYLTSSQVLQFYCVSAFLSTDMKCIHCQSKAEVEHFMKRDHVQFFSATWIIEESWWVPVFA